MIKMSDFKEFRKTNKLTQIAAAKYFGCTQSFISQIEQQSCPVPEKFISKILEDKYYNPEALMRKNDRSEESNVSVELRKIISLLEDKVRFLENNSDRLELENRYLKNEVESLKKELAAAVAVPIVNAG